MADTARAYVAITGVGVSSDGTGYSPGVTFQWAAVQADSTQPGGGGTNAVAFTNGDSNEKIRENVVTQVQALAEQGLGISGIEVEFVTG